VIKRSGGVHEISIFVLFSSTYGCTGKVYIELIWALSNHGCGFLLRVAELHLVVLKGEKSHRIFRTAM
jgi:hypothetical protein